MHLSKSHEVSLSLCFYEAFAGREDLFEGKQSLLVSLLWSSEMDLSRGLWEEVEEVLGWWWWLLLWWSWWPFPGDEPDDLSFLRLDFFLLLSKECISALRLRYVFLSSWILSFKICILRSASKSSARGVQKLYLDVGWMLAKKALGEKLVIEIPDTVAIAWDDKRSEEEGEYRSVSFLSLFADAPRVL